MLRERDGRHWGNARKIRSVRVEILRCFLAVTERRDVSKTTRFLRVARPALSERVGRLRRRLNGRLFVENGQGVALASSNVLLEGQTRRVVRLIRGARSRVGASAARFDNSVCVNNNRAGNVQVVAHTVDGTRSRRPLLGFRLFDNGTRSIASHLSGNLLSFKILIRPAGVSGCSFVGLPAGSV